MDKNPGGLLAEVFPNTINTVLCQDAFAKERVVKMLAGLGALPTILIDFDLLYAGYARSGMIAGGGGNLTAYSPTEGGWEGVFKEVAARVSAQKSVLVVDSVNGFLSIFGGEDSGRYADSCVMMLSSCVGCAGGRIFLFYVAEPAEGGGWVLRPTGRRVLEIAPASRFFARRRNGKILVEALPPDDGSGAVFQL